MVLATALAGAPAVTAQTASGVGARACSAFSRAVETDSESALDAYVSWSQGFISGFNWANVRERDARIDAPGLIHWLAEYCRSHPTTPVHAAVQELIRIHAR